MSSLTNELAHARILQHAGEMVLHSETAYDGVTIVETAPENLIGLLTLLKEDEALNYHFLTTLNVIHYPDQTGKELGITYHLHNWIDNRRLRVRVWISSEKPFVSSISGIWPSANWMERQEFDFFGVQFTGHPNLKRILNVEDLDVFPLRKEYRLEDGTRTDKDDRFFGREGNYQQRLD
ncbi:MAG: NADH-quinone oxidoreductase subunit C [Bacteroidetes bacterium]|nr:NADH-quinone oxidoreductase subunit C [Bacteroidota bacterium]